MASIASKRVVIVGGHGKIGLRLSTLLSQSSHSTTSIIRDEAHSSSIISTGAKPHVLSLEDSPIKAFSGLFKGKDVIYFCAGAGGKGGDERTKRVDYEGALKVFDAIEGVEEGNRPRLVLVSAIDVRDPERIPEHYDEEDIEISKKYHKGLGTYIKWKYEADKNLVKRTLFKWTIIRPGTLNDDAGTGKVTIGRTHLRPGIPRDDVAKVLAMLVDREDAAGLTFDLVGGETGVERAVDGFIKRGETDWN